MTKTKAGKVFGIKSVAKAPQAIKPPTVTIVAVEDPSGRDIDFFRWLIDQGHKTAPQQAAPRHKISLCSEQ
jgi:hypothetical protein